MDFHPTFFQLATGPPDRARKRGRWEVGEGEEPAGGIEQNGDTDNGPWLAAVLAAVLAATLAAVLAADAVVMHRRGALS